MNELNNIDFVKYIDQLITLGVLYAPRILMAAILLTLGWWMINNIVRGAVKVMERREIDASLRPFLKGLLKVTLRVVLIVTVVGMVGIEVTSFIAVMGTAGLAIGLALQGTLQNFAGGVIILLIKPFKVGDVIDAKGYLGTVKEIRIFYTLINTFDKKLVYIPNGALANTDLTNVSKEETRRNEWIFGISYGDDYDVAKKLLQDLLDADERILKDPAPLIALRELGNSSVNIVVRAWTMAPDLWPVFFDINEKVYKQFPKHGLTFPFPQLDVHIQKQ